MLKQKGWEERPEGVAALSILLLQDLAVAPLLVILPLLAGGAEQSGGGDLGVLAFKATFGFAGVLLFFNQILRVAFDFVAQAKSTETFVAATLLVAVGMGRLAEALGLSETTGAFAAGVLLAGNRYRAQIQADIKPFEGILLGVFFMTAGAGLDPSLVLEEAPTLALGIVAFLLVKCAVLFAAGPALGLTVDRAAKVAVLLAGGGEFSFIIFKLAEDLGILSAHITELLSASVIISMSLTPLLGEIADTAGDALSASGSGAGDEGGGGAGGAADEALELFERVDADGSGAIDLDELRVFVAKAGLPAAQADRAFEAVDVNGDGRLTLAEWRAGLATTEVQELLRPEKDDGVNANAVVVCGYGVLGRAVCSRVARGARAREFARLSERGLLSRSSLERGTRERVGSRASRAAPPPRALPPSSTQLCATQVCSAVAVTDAPFVAVDLDPARVAAGVLDGVNVVYGDGASAGLLAAVGVRAPRAFVIAYASLARRLEATCRLREAYPTAPIYARARGGPSGKEARDLVDAGATEVVAEAAEAGLRLADLLDLPTFDLGDAARNVRASSPACPVEYTSDGRLDEPLFSDDDFNDLADECGVTVDELRDTYAQFLALDADADGQIGVDELERVLLASSSRPLDETAIQAWVDDQVLDGAEGVDFTQYARARFRRRDDGDLPE